ncbi:MAG: hypothetical protein J3Q66DRAFT_157580 [Benniella sp.]|nr:MAG: hypothetical protein J3Q66DRAFT_157580 [Benniella sp.]
MNDPTADRHNSPSLYIDSTYRYLTFTHTPPPLPTMPTTTVPEKTIRVNIWVDGADPIELDLPLTTKILKLKRMIRNKIGMPVKWQHITHRNRVLVNTSRLEDYWAPDRAQFGVFCHDVDCTGQCLGASYESDQGDDSDRMDDSECTRIGSDDGYDGSGEEDYDDYEEEEDYDDYEEEDYDSSVEEDYDDSVEEDDEGYVEEDYDD